MANGSKVWTTVGSAGTLSQADLAKVILHKSIIQLGAEVLPPSSTADTEVAAPAFGVAFPDQHAVVRYNVTPVDGLFGTGRFRYGLQLRFRGKVGARLIEVDLESGSEKDLVVFDSATAPPKSGFQVYQAVQGWESTGMDFVQKAYYVEALLTAPAIIISRPAAISIIKVYIVTIT